MSDVLVESPRLLGLIAADVAVERLGGGTIWAEGPVYFREGDFLLYSDIPNDRMMRWSAADGLTVYRQPATYTNGHTRDNQGRLVSCSHGARRVHRTEPDGTVTVLADRYQGRRLNSPNDVVVKSDDTLWFTDPFYGIKSNLEGHQAPREQPGQYVYRFDPASGNLTVVADDFEMPNGIAFSPDEALLYVADTGLSERSDGPRHIRVFDVVDGQRLANGRLFATCDAGMFDGFRLDTHGNLFTSAGDGIHVYAPDGERLGKILIPEKVANCEFGGPSGDQLFVTASSSLYRVQLTTRGATSGRAFAA
ncbi:MAG: SMP-30/gluconolactonase/LRE family protein [Chloroflexi bacterium]|nr:SMP-30/gluconolactonase/LRE family protein [Chloroflexota bacterium]